jgi:hypothetical protein
MGTRAVWTPCKLNPGSSVMGPGASSLYYLICPGPFSEQKSCMLNRILTVSDVTVTHLSKLSPFSVHDLVP